MATPLQLLLRLPPTLRCHALTPLLRSPNGSNTSRLFSNTLHHLQHPKPPKPTLRPRPQTQTAPTESTPSTRPPRSPPKPNVQYVPKQTGLETLLSSFRESSAPHLLLYKAPSHTSFYLNSYLLGSILLVGAVVQAKNAGYLSNQTGDRKPAIWVRVASITPAVLLAVFATTFFLAPWKLVQSVALVRNAVSTAAGADAGSGRKFVEVVLQFEMKHPLPVLQRIPFVKARGGGSIATELNAVFIDRRVRSSETLRFFSVPLSRAQAWTAEYFTPSAPQPKTILELLKGFNESLVNVWPALKRDTRKMFLRDGMARVRIPGHGNWKMDLHGCEMLEAGQVLEKVVRVAPGTVEPGWWTWLRQRVE